MFLSQFIDKLKTEPAAVVGTIVAVLALVGVRVSDGDAATVTQLFVLLLPLIGAVVVRQQVTPTTTAHEAVQQAVAETLDDVAQSRLDPDLWAAIVAAPAAEVAP